MWVRRAGTRMRFNCRGSARAVTGRLLDGQRGRDGSVLGRAAAHASPCPVRGLTERSAVIKRATTVR